MNNFVGLKRAVWALAVALLVRAATSTVTGSELTVLHAFGGDDGAVPMGRLLVGQDGRLYGTTSSGGTDNHGVVFALKVDGSDFQLIRSFGDMDIGLSPSAGVIQRSDGKLYGVAGSRPGLGSGSLYRIKADGSEPELLRTFDYSADGSYLTNEPLEASDGRLYGVAQWGGSGLGGTIYSWNPADGSFVTIKNFALDYVTPVNPKGRLIEGTDGRLYGTSEQGGSGNRGTVFAVEKDGSGFVDLGNLASTDASNPANGVILGADGRLYGCTSGFGTNNIVFSLKIDGSDFVQLHRFNSPNDGDRPSALLQGPDGRLYGACRWGGPANNGSVFALNTDGTGFEVLHFMDPGTDGFMPEGGMIFGPGGRLYGTNSYGGANLDGTVFSIAIEPDQAPEVAVRSPLFGRLETPGSVYMVATHAPTSFTFAGLPAWMTYNEEYRFLSGVPDAMGDFTFTVTATNAHGSGSKEITLKVGKKLAQVHLTAGDQPYDGTPKAATVTTNPEGLATIVTYNGSMTPPTEIGTYTVVATIDDPTREGMSQRTMKILDPAVIAPFITVPPSSANIEIGKPVTFMVTAVGASPLTYQWRKNYTNIPGASEASYSIPSASVADEGDYSVEVTNALGYRVSEMATLRVFSPPVIVAQPILRTAVLGGTVTFSVDASGTGPFTYQWKRNGVVIPGATDSVLTLSGVAAGQAGNYSVVVSNPATSVSSNTAALTIDSTPRLINVSCRAAAGSGDGTLIVGFFIAGTGWKDVLIRGIGPKLKDYNVPVVVADPVIRVYDSDGLLKASNDDWDLSLAPAFDAVGAFPLDPGSKDAAIEVSLKAGLYTVHLVNGGESGDGLIEVYDASRDLGTRLTNVSSRLGMGAGQTIILGTALIGSPVHVLARNVGPGLAQYLPEGAVVLADPHLRVYSGETEIAVNDDWDVDTGDWFVPAGAFPLTVGSNDAAIRVPFNPGGYTIHATDSSGGAGIALIELYQSQ